jgi:hypothetical protein
MIYADSIDSPLQVRHGTTKRNSDTGVWLRDPFGAKNVISGPTVPSFVLLSSYDGLVIEFECVDFVSVSKAET